MKEKIKKEISEICQQLKKTLMETIFEGEKNKERQPRVSDTSCKITSRDG